MTFHKNCIVRSIEAQNVTYTVYTFWDIISHEIINTTKKEQSSKEFRYNECFIRRIKYQ